MSTENLIVGLCLMLILAVVPGCAHESDNPDVLFAKQVFGMMVTGDKGAIEMIDWSNLQSFGTDYGALDRAMASDTIRQQNREGFISGFSGNDGSSQGPALNADLATNWRVKDEDDGKTVVIADAPKGLIEITVSKQGGVQKVSAIEFR